MKKYLNGVLAVGLALSMCACGAPASQSQSASGADSASTAEAADTTTETDAADSDLAYIQGKGSMTIGYTVYEPMNYTDENGEFTGFDTELATAVCEKLGVEPDFVEINWDTKFVELEAKSIDCVWNGMTLTDDIQANQDHHPALCEERPGGGDELTPITPPPPTWWARRWRWKPVPPVSPPWKGTKT